MPDNKLYEKLRIAFHYGIKAMKKHPENDDCDDSYFDRAIEVINRVFPKSMNVVESSVPNESGVIILYKGLPLKNLLFIDFDRARNWLKMTYSNRSFKEPRENIFVCKRYGCTFKIVELEYKKH